MKGFRDAGLEQTLVGRGALGRGVVWLVEVDGEAGGEGTPRWGLREVEVYLD